MVEDIDKYTQHPVIIHQCNTISIGWKRYREGWIKLNCDGAYKDSLGASSTYVVGFFRTWRVDGSKDTRGELELVTLSPRKCGECTWESSLLGNKVSANFKQKITQKL
ncbi:hypothetical protein L195_g054901 [Trifolium pratense]|uniref:Uncharacterized protein n=1 Tax=Trifolium pratense TaxID=57577 RepID=A0A2K3KIH2_TRIPR|nr:hypothetical protein L195_g054901 [Trifolium pratense]